jgi:hypothetical protein
MLHGAQRISKRGRPLVRAAVYMFTGRSISDGCLYRAEYQALLERNGQKKAKALVAVMPFALRLIFSIARDRRSCTVEPRRRPLRLGSGGATA